MLAKEKRVVRRPGIWSLNLKSIFISYVVLCTCRYYYSLSLLFSKASLSFCKRFQNTAASPVSFSAQAQCHSSLGILSWCTCSPSWHVVYFSCARLSQSAQPGRDLGARSLKGCVSEQSLGPLAGPCCGPALALYSCY